MRGISSLSVYLVGWFVANVTTTADHHFPTNTPLSVALVLLRSRTR